MCFSLFQEYVSYCSKPVLQVLQGCASHCFRHAVLRMFPHCYKVVLLTVLTMCLLLFQDSALSFKAMLLIFPKLHSYCYNFVLFTLPRLYFSLFQGYLSHFFIGCVSTSSISTFLTVPRLCLSLLQDCFS